MMIVTFGKRASIKSGKLYTAWEKQAVKHLLGLKLKPYVGEYPIEIHFFLFRDSHRKWDIDNVFCGCLDVLQKVEIIPDDDATKVIPVFAGWAIDKKNPRVILKLQPITKSYFRKDLCK